MKRTRSAVIVAAVSGLMFLGLAIKPAPTRMEGIERVAPQPAIPLASFNSIELHNGVKAVLHFGTPQRVTLLKGSPDVTQIGVTGERLVIDKCRDKCPRGYELQVEIVTPLVTAISVDNGSWLESRGNFPLHTALSLAVAHGGTLDARAISSNSITAAVNQGGRILARPQVTMTAAVSNGGVITYWGEAQVISSTQHGGVVNKGQAGDADKPLTDSAAPACPPNPTTPVTRKRPRTIVI